MVMRMTTSKESTSLSTLSSVPVPLWSMKWNSALNSFSVCILRTLADRIRKKYCWWKICWLFSGWLVIMQKKVSRFYMPYNQTCTTMTCCQVFWFPWCSYGKYWLVQLDKMWYLNWVLGVKGSPPYMVLSITTEEPQITASGWSTSPRCCVYGKENCKYKYANEASGQHEWTFWGVMSNLARFYFCKRRKHLKPMKS